MKKNTIGFTLLALKTEQFATFGENFTESNKSNLTTELEFKINKEHKQISVFSTFTFEQEKKAFIKIQVSCQFGIQPESWVQFSNDSKITFPKAFIEHISMITIGSLRGVLHVKTDNTKFNKFLLPTIDVTSLVTKDVEFSLS